MTSESYKIQSVQVISRAAEVLRALSETPQGMSLGQIANRVNLPRSTVQRIVASLTEEGLTTVGAAGRGIKLGPEIQRLARSGSNSPREQFRPILESISKETGETVDLSVMQDTKMHFIDQIEGRQRLRAVSAIGDKFPLSSTANGKAALACLDEFEATKILMNELSTLPPEDRKLAELMEEIAQIRKGALAKDLGEHTDGISALGFAVTSESGEIYAVSIPVPSNRFQTKREELVAALETARASLAPL